MIRKRGSGQKEMVSNSNDQYNEHWIKAGGLIVDLPSMEKGFQDTERCRQDISDYVQYRESLVAGTCPDKGHNIK